MALSQKNLDILHSIIVFVAVSIFMIAGSWNLAQNVTYELSDYASNTLFVLDARHSLLTTGNYSRVNFYHPGPAFLYVQTAGEIIFHDILGLVRMPFGGQLLGLAVLNGFWLSLLWFIMVRLSNSAGAATIGVAAYVGGCLLAGPGFPFNSWLPYLYIGPFAVFTLSLCRVLVGRFDVLLPLSISFGFLFHGHAAFIGITAVMLAIALAAHLVLKVRGCDCGYEFVFSQDFLKRNKAGIAGAVAIVLVFLAFPVVETVISPPGPFVKYATYGNAHISNAVSDSARYMLPRWGGPAGFVIGFLSSLVPLVLYRKNKEKLITYAAFLISIAAASAAVFFYTKFGVDMLDYQYIIYFYSAVPALLLGMLAIVVYGAVDRRMWRRATAAVSAAVLGGLLVTADLGPLPKQNPGIPEFYSSFRMLVPGFAVIDFDTSRDWRVVWSTSLGMFAHAKRNHDTAFCVRANWHVSFTRAIQCPDTVPPGAAVVMVGAAPDQNSVETPRSIRKLGVEVTLIPPPP